MSKLKEFVNEVDEKRGTAKRKISLGLDRVVAARDMVHKVISGASAGGKAVAKKRVLSNDPKAIANRNRVRRWRERNPES